MIIENKNLMNKNMLRNIETSNIPAQNIFNIFILHLLKYFTKTQLKI